MPPPIIVLFRADLRLSDNGALHCASSEGGPVIPLFVHETDGPAAFRPLGGAAKWWLHHSLADLQRRLGERGSRLVLRQGVAQQIVGGVVEETGAKAVFWNRRYSQAGRAADEELAASLKERGIAIGEYPGQLLHEPTGIETTSGGYYKVYTPFAKRVMNEVPIGEPLPAPANLPFPDHGPDSLSLDDLDLLPTVPDWSAPLAKAWAPGETGALADLARFADDALSNYDEDRERPDRAGTSRMSPRLARGELTPAMIWQAIGERAERVAAGEIHAYRRQIVFREFAWHQLWFNPDLAERNYNRDFDRFEWRGDEDALRAWQRGQTGYPIVDAGMRQLWQTGWMHNRIRMVVGSFLAKNLRLHWHHGERWFHDTLVDQDDAQNAFNWQWIAGSGADASPYFRIFNPVTQGTRYDPDGAYVRRFVPELANMPAKHIHEPWKAPQSVLEAAGVQLGRDYPAPIVDHGETRQEALDAYRAMRDG